MAVIEAGSTGEEVAERILAREFVDGGHAVCRASVDRGAPLTNNPYCPVLCSTAAMAYYNGVAYPGSDYDWGYYTSNQTDLGNRPVFWPRGKVLGGSSAVNGAVSRSIAAFITSVQCTMSELSGLCHRST